MTVSKPADYVPDYVIVRIEATGHLAGATLEVMAGGSALVAPEPVVTKVVGGVLVLHGVDHGQAAIRVIIWGEPVQTVTHQVGVAGAKQLGADDELAEFAGTAFDTSVGLTSFAVVEYQLAYTANRTTTTGELSDDVLRLLDDAPSRMQTRAGFRVVEDAELKDLIRRGRFRTLPTGDTPTGQPGKWFYTTEAEAMDRAAAWGNVSGTKFTLIRADIPVKSITFKQLHIDNTPTMPLGKSAFFSEFGRGLENVPPNF